MSKTQFPFLPPAPEGCGKVIFQFVCSFTRGRGYPSLWSQVLSGEYPSLLFQILSGGILLASGPWSFSGMGGYPCPRTSLGYTFPPNRTKTGYPPPHPPIMKSRGRYSSCGQVGSLSCWIKDNILVKYPTRWEAKQKEIFSKNSKTSIGRAYFLFQHATQNPPSFSHRLLGSSYFFRVLSLWSCAWYSLRKADLIITYFTVKLILHLTMVHHIRLPPKDCRTQRTLDFHTPSLQNIFINFPCKNIWYWEKIALEIPQKAATVVIVKDLECTVMVVGSLMFVGARSQRTRN